MAKKLLITANMVIAFAFIGALTAFAQVPDVTSPVITGVNAMSIGQTGATINWTTDEPADSQVEYGTSTAYGLSSSLVIATTTAHSISVIGLTESTTYHYLVKSKDDAGNLATSTDQTFTTLAPVDATAPVISGVSATNITDTSAVINWTINELADGQVEYGTSTAYGLISSLAPATTTAHQIALGSLVPLTTYHYFVKSKDAANNTATSTDYTFTTLTPTSTPPVIGEVSVRVKVEPRMLNVKSKGKWVQVRVTFPDGYDARDVSLSSVKLNGVLSPENTKIKAKKIKEHKKDRDDDDEEDEDDDRESALHLKFSRSAVINLLTAGTAATSTTPFTMKDIVLSGNIGDKTFSGKTTVGLLGFGDFPDGTVVRAADDSDVYVIIKGKKRHIPTARAFEEMGYKWNQIEIVSQAITEAYEDDVLFRAEGSPAVYIVSGGKKRHVTNPSLFEAQGLDWADITVVSKKEIEHYATVSTITLVRASGDKKVYFISGGKRQWVPSESVFNKRGFKWDDIVTVDDSELSKHQEGAHLD
ncbi:MAG: fibronectin type III domain-containing protein [Candidatus Azambacteria bacterium]|nr:fibronectin type III domain-containing protein [Candidatus Azambacteria bacterium]